MAGAKNDQVAIGQIRRKELADELANAIAAAKLKGESISGIEADFRAKKLKQTEDTNAKILAENKATKDAELKTATDLTSSLGSLEDLVFSIKSSNLKAGSKAALDAAKKDFNVKKSLSIASATISGIEGVINALSAKSTIPEPYGEVLRIANAVSVGVASAANIAKIAASQFNGGGSVAASVPRGGAGNTPSGSGGSTLLPSQTFGLGKGSSTPSSSPQPQIVLPVEGPGGLNKVQTKVATIQSRASNKL